MPDEDHRYRHQRPFTVMISAEGIAARLAELPTRKEMHRAVFLGSGRASPGTRARFGPRNIFRAGHSAAEEIAQTGKPADRRRVGRRRPRTAKATVEKHVCRGNPRTLESLSWAAWHSKRQRTPHHTPRGPRPSVTRRHRLALQTIENRVRPSERIGRFMN